MIMLEVEETGIYYFSFVAWVWRPVMRSALCTHVDMETRTGTINQ